TINSLLRRLVSMSLMRVVAVQRCEARPQRSATRSALPNATLRAGFRGWPGVGTAGTGSSACRFNAIRTYMPAFPCGSCAAQHGALAAARDGATRIAYRRGRRRRGAALARRDVDATVADGGRLPRRPARPCRRTVALHRRSLRPGLVAACAGAGTAGRRAAGRGVPRAGRRRRAGGDRGASAGRLGSLVLLACKEAAAIAAVAVAPAPATPAARAGDRWLASAWRGLAR